MMLRKIKRYLILIGQGFRIHDKVFLAIMLVLNKVFGRSFEKEICMKNEDGFFKVGTLRDFHSYSVLRDEEFRSFFKLGEKDIFIDVGANIGKYSFLVASKYKNSRVIAIEPDNRCLAIFKENLYLNRIDDRVEIIEKVVFSENTEKELFFNMTNHEKNTIYKEEINGVDKYKGREYDASYKAVKVETISLDFLCKNIFQKVGLIKLDIQGAELSALKGAKNILLKDRPNIIFESWNEMRFQEIYDFLKPLKYEIQKINDTNYFAYFLDKS